MAVVFVLISIKTITTNPHILERIKPVTARRRVLSVYVIYFAEVLVVSNVRAIASIIFSFDITLLRILLLGEFHEIVKQLFLAFLS
jgi:hypothetical protein